MNDLLTVELSAVRRVRGHIEACHEQPHKADMFAVYIRSPLAMHVRDFDAPKAPAGTYSDYADAFIWARELAKHIGAEFFTYLPHYAIEPQRDAFAGTGQPGTNFEGCHEHEATQWAVFHVVPLEGAPGNADLVEDYPSRVAAETAIEKLMRGELAPKPEWPRSRDVALLDLLSRRGYKVEHDMGGERLSRHYSLPGDPYPNSAPRAYILITTTDGGSLPDSADFMIGAYRGDGMGTPFATLTSEDGYPLLPALKIMEQTARALAFGGAEG